MPGQSQANLIVFRDTRRRLSSRALLQELAEAVRQVALDPRNSALALDGLIRAGELECALADGGWVEKNPAAPLTDALADRFVGSGTPGAAEGPLRVLQQTVVPETLVASPPEGFAYYALHPADLVAAANEKPTRARLVWGTLQNLSGSLFVGRLALPANRSGAPRAAAALLPAAALAFRSTLGAATLATPGAGALATSALHALPARGIAPRRLLPGTRRGGAAA